ncbi:MAG TPA: molybdenum ABC transporter ATP-binding protein [Afifellaceae bacterium]|nr:molybdenum ABC transporter ATP-binding protein [Afifellaceae bacterium]
MLEVDVHHRAGGFALDVGVSAGDGVTALFGRSGAGKSTLVGMIAGLVRPATGRIVLNDRVLFDSENGIDLPARQRRVGVVFQEARLFPHLNVRRNLLYGQWAGGRRNAPDLGVVCGLLGLDAMLDRSPDTLSGGEAQRVAIGRALLSAPDILLLDEPLSQLDGARRADILPWLDRLAHEAGTPIVYVSHAFDEITRLADNLIVISDGGVLASGPVEEVISRIDLGPATGRHEAGSLLRGEIGGHDEAYGLTTLSLNGADLTVPAIAGPAGAPVRLRIRARDVVLALERPLNISVRNVIPVKIVEIAVEEGPFAEVLTRVGDQNLRARITRKSAQELGLEPGAQAYALVKSVAFVRRTPASR